MDKPWAIHGLSMNNRCTVSPHSGFIMSTHEVFSWWQAWHLADPRSVFEGAGEVQVPCLRIPGIPRIPADRVPQPPLGTSLLRTLGVRMTRVQNKLPKIICWWFMFPNSSKNNVSQCAHPHLDAPFRGDPCCGVGFLYLPPIFGKLFSYNWLRKFSCCAKST